MPSVATKQITASVITENLKDILYRRAFIININTFKIRFKKLNFEMFTWPYWWMRKIDDTKNMWINFPELEKKYYCCSKCFYSPWSGDGDNSNELNHVCFSSHLYSPASWCCCWSVVAAIPSTVNFYPRHNTLLFLSSDRPLNSFSYWSFRIADKPW